MVADPSFRKGLRDSVLIFFAVGAFGLAYGVLAIEVGFPIWLAVLSSFVILSGAAQFAMMGLISAGSSPVILAATGLGLRHLPMSATLARLIGKQPLGVRVRLAYVLVDETFGLTLRAAATDDVDDIVAYKSAADMTLLAGWVIGTGIGAWFGGAIDPAGVGIGVLFGLLFLGLAIPMMVNRRDWVVGAITIVTTIGAILVLPEAWQITSAAVVASLVAVFTGE
jgi:predicted branched-subunit amino acid permease